MLKTAPDEGLNDQEWKAFLNEQDFGQVRRYRSHLPTPFIKRPASSCGGVAPQRPKP
jgi:hypothetical protein